MALLHNRINRKELKERMLHDTRKRITLSYYKYVNLENPIDFRNRLYEIYNRLDVLGRIYVAYEGVNAQLSVPVDNWEAFKQAMNEFEFFRNMRLNIAVEAEAPSFFVLTIKVREKIVADGITDPAFNPSETGIHLDAESFNRITDDPNTIVVDMRNGYESEVGHFENAITPEVETFRESLPIIADMLAEHKDKNLVMYCTGGIRCEKAGAYMRYRGFKNVFQLEGGIIEYTRQVRARGLKNKFLGKNFVFDERLGERISADVISNCHQCGNRSDAHTNCANDYCHHLFIQCEHCRAEYEGCCSPECRDFMRLPAAERKRIGAGLTFKGSHRRGMHG